MVYDKNTGDHKSQYELSDGSIVQGEYSLLQPDGFVREVTYIADNTRGLVFYSTVYINYYTCVYTLQFTTNVFFS